jgi:hypothetical protein
LLSCLNFAFPELIHVLIFPHLCLQLFQLPFLELFYFLTFALSERIYFSQPLFFLLLLIILYESASTKTDNAAKARIRGRGTLEVTVSAKDVSNVRVAKELATK